MTSKPSIGSTKTNFFSNYFSTCLQSINLFIGKKPLSRSQLKSIALKKIATEYEKLIWEIGHQNKAYFRNAFTWFFGQSSGLRPKNRGLLAAGLSITQNIPVPLFKFLLPFPVPGRWGRGAVYRVYEKLWIDSFVPLTALEKKLLKKNDSYEHYLLLKNYYIRYPVAKKIRRGVSHTANAARIVTEVAVIVYAYEQMKGGLLSSEEFLNDQQYQLKDNQVQLLIDIVPFPHVAIRVGNIVYSYGQEHMTGSGVYRYIENRKIHDAITRMKKREGIKDKVMPAPTTYKAKLFALFDSTTDYLIEKSGLAKLPKSMQIITINLSKENRDNLKRHLVMQTGKRYKNSTFVNDCLTMVLRALEKESDFNFTNRLWDASPSQTGMLLAMLKAAGDKSIGPIYQIASQEIATPLKHLLRNSYVNLLESYLFIEFFWMHQPQRAFMDIVYTEDDLQAYDQKVKDYMLVWKNNVETFLQNNQYQLLSYQLEQFLNAKQSSFAKKLEQKTDLIESINFIFNPAIERSERLMESKQSDFQTIMFNKFKIEFLQQQKVEMLNKLKEN